MRVQFSKLLGEQIKKGLNIQIRLQVTKINNLA